MFVFLMSILILLIIFLVGVAAMAPTESVLSVFELERRSHHGPAAMRAFRREQMLADVLSLQRVICALFLVIITVTAGAAFGPILGICLALLVALFYGALASRLFTVRGVQKLYARIEPSALDFIQAAPWLFDLIRTPSRPSVRPVVASYEELEHIIAQSSDILTPDEKKLLTNGLTFGDKLVGAVMTPRSVIESISKSEFLGPLTLDELHKLGHSRLPVTDGDIDHVVGVLHLKSLLALDIKRSATAEKAMEPNVFYIREDQTLQHALAAFLKVHHHLFIVVNEYRETVGLLTLEDVIEALLGRKIVDEFDAHDDLRAVAERNPGHNNEPQKGKDV